MTPDAILKDLTESRELPRRALRAASEQREEMLPLFLDIVERATAAPVSELRDYDGLLLIFHLLGEWREARAYRALAKLLRRDPEGLDVLIGDAITESSARVMAGVCDGDLQPLFDIIEDSAADEFIRGEMFGSLAILALQDPALRPVVSTFLMRFFQVAGREVTTPVWVGWTEAISALGLSEMTPLVRKVYQRDQIDPLYSRFADFERRLDRTLQDPSAAWFRSKPRHRFIEDTVEELSTWYGFSEAYLSGRDRAPPADPGNLFEAGVPAPHLNELRSVGRNDPCPCGSGKKFKKCCLH